MTKKQAQAKAERATKALRKPHYVVKLAGEWVITDNRPDGVLPQ